MCHLKQEATAQEAGGSTSSDGGGVTTGADASNGKRPRVAQGQHQDPNQASAPPFPLPAPPATIIAAVEGVVGAVMLSPELVERVLGFLAGWQRRARVDVDRAAVVCRLWRDVAYGEEVWGRIAPELQPLMPEGWDGRLYVAEQGRCLVERRVWKEDEWCGGLDFASRCGTRDNLRLLSAEGRLGVAITGADESGCHIGITGTDRREVVGPAFSAASRDPEHQRFHDIQDFFARSHEADNPSVLCMRITVSDFRTGRRALLYESRKHDPLEAIFDPHSARDTGVPDDSLLVMTDVTPLLSAAWKAHGGLGVRVSFFLREVEGQDEGVAERDKLYCVVGGDEEQYGDRDSCASVAFVDVHSSIVGTTLLALLGK
jgi:hypothetical protein